MLCHNSSPTNSKQLKIVASTTTADTAAAACMHSISYSVSLTRCADVDNQLHVRVCACHTCVRAQTLPPASNTYKSQPEGSTATVLLQRRTARKNEKLCAARQQLYVTSCIPSIRHTNAGSAALEQSPTMIRHPTHAHTPECMLHKQTMTAPCTAVPLCRAVRCRLPPQLCDSQAAGHGGTGVLGICLLWGSL